MKRLLLQLAILAVLVAPLSAQFIGYVDIQSSDFVAFLNVTVAGQSTIIPNSGQGAHYLTYCINGGTATAVQIQLEASIDTFNWFPITAQGTNTSGCTVLTGGGYFPQMRVNLVTYTNNGTNIYAKYTGMAGPLPFSTSSAPASNVTIVNPLDGSGNVKVDCAAGCSGGNPNGQATMANSAPMVIASNQSAVPVSQAPTLSAAALISGQQAVTGSAVALPSQAVTRTPCILNITGGTQTIYVGPSGVTTGNGFPIAVGGAFCGLTVSNLNQIFVIAGTTGSTASWLAQ